MTSGSRPTILTIGNHTQRSLWLPLSEHYRLAFLDNAFHAEAAGANVPDIIPLRDYATDDVVQDARARAMLAVTDLVNSIADGLAVDREVSDLHGVALAGWLAPALYEAWASSMGRISACAALHEKEGVAGVLVHEDVTPIGRVVSQWGNAVGIPTLHAPHANHFMRPGTKDIHCSATAKHLGVAGTYMRDWYSACGVSDDRMTVVGAPRWDHLVDEEKLPSRWLARNGLGVKDDTKFVLGFATTWYQLTTVWGVEPEAYLESCTDRVVAAAKELDAFLVVAMHPGESPDQENHYADKIKKAGLRGAVTRHHNEHTLRASDCLVVVGPSNVGVRASILGTPVVELYTPGARYPDYGPPGTWGDDLIPLIRQAVADGPKKDFSEAMCCGLDGKGTERTVDWVRSLCQ